MRVDECESVKTLSNEKFSQQQTWRNHSLNATRKEVVEKLWASEESRSTMERQFPVRGSVPFTRETARYRDEDEENKAKFEAKIRVCIRCEHKRYTMRMPETTSAQGSPTENHSFTASKTVQRKTRGQVRTKTRLRCRTSQGSVRS